MKDSVLFETERLLVRRWNPDDASWYFPLTQDPGLNKGTISNDPWRYRQATVESARSQIETWIRYHSETGLGVWPVILRSSGSTIGLCGIKPILPDGDSAPDWEMMYRFVTAEWGKGFASELAPAIVRYGFEQRKLPRITGGVLPENQASKKVLLKAGLKLWRPIAITGVKAELFAITDQEYRAGGSR
jgi:RimJ/RimL family protein N-acetyltransferase